jgi:group I intron endonuclease
MQIKIEKKDRMKSGIYKITNFLDGKIYIGQTTCFYKRANFHKSELQRNKHGNHKLQNAVNKYGIKVFLFEVIHICEIDALDIHEANYLAHYKNNKQLCYNHDFIPKRKSHDKLNHAAAVKRSWDNDPERKIRAANIFSQTKKNNPHMVGHNKKTRKYIDPTGQLHNVENLKTFCQENDLGYEVMRKMAKGSYIEHKGWKSAEIQKAKKENRESKIMLYRFRNPNGEIVETRNIAHLARETNSDRSGFFRLINGRLKTFKGWSFIEKLSLESK